MNDTTSPSALEATSGSALVSTTDTLQVFSGIAAFDAAQRMARALCSSTLVPREYQGQQGLANSLIALEIASRMRLSPLVVMQNMTPIHGRPTWSSKFLIATVNASGRFSPLRFVFDDKENPTRCYAVATDRATGEVLEGETITLELARREGWWSRKDRQGNETSKWQTMTGQMLRYRAAAWWANVYCPEIALGLMTQEEALDIEPVSVREVEAVLATPEPMERALPEAGVQPSPEAPAEPVTDTPAPKRRSSTARQPSLPKPLPAEDNEPSRSDPMAEADQGQEPAVEGTQRNGEAAAAGDQQTRQAGEDVPPEPEPAQAAASSASDPVETGLLQIPRIGTLLELDVAYGRVNQLLSSGRINDQDAQQLWAAIGQRRNQLEARAEATGSNTEADA